MSIISSDLVWYKSSGANSNGGSISGTQIVDAQLNNLFTDVTGDESATGITVYKKVFIKNTHMTLTLQTPILWINRIPASDELISLALGTAVDSNPIDNSLVYSAPINSAQAIAFINLAPGASQGVWIKKIVNKGASAFSAANLELIVSGQSL